MNLILYLGPGNYAPRVMAHGLSVYREGSATLTPAPAHAVQPSTVIHQLSGGSSNNKQDISLPNTPVSVQFSRAIVSGKRGSRICCGTGNYLTNFLRKQCWGSVSVLDPYSGAIWIRIRNTDSDPHM